MRRRGYERERFGAPPGRHGREQKGLEGIIVSKEDIADIIGGNSDKLVQHAETLGRNLKAVSSSQVRNIFNYVASMPKYDKFRLDTLRPKVAYVASKEGGLRSLRGVLEQAIPLVKDEQSFQNFRAFMEAILAYHKAYRGD